MRAALIILVVLFSFKLYAQKHPFIFPKHHGEREVGAFFALASIANGLGPVCLQAIYDRTQNLPYPGPGSMFLFASVVYFTGTVVACFLPADKANCNLQEEQESHGEEDEEADEMILDGLESQREPLLGATERLE